MIVPLNRSLLHFLRMASSSSIVRKPPNILVFSPNDDQIKKCVRSALEMDKYVVYGISAADLKSAPWQENATALIASAEHCEEGDMAQIRDFAANHLGKVILLGGHFEDKNIMKLADITSLRDGLSSLGLPVAPKKCDISDAPNSGVHVICQGACDLPSLDYEVIPELPDEFAFNSDLYFDRLSTRRLGRLCLYASTATSTFDLLPKRGPLLNGTVAIADQQTTGKGRGGNVWLSPVGCAMFSAQLVIPVSSTVLSRRIPLLQHLAALAVVRGLSKSITDDNVKLKLKWPNDIYLKTATEGDLIKMGGVLALSSFSGSDAVCNIGVGFNLDNESPTMSLNSLLKKEDQMRKEEYYAMVLNAFEELIDLMERGSEAEVYSLYYKYWLHSEQNVEVTTSSGDMFSAVVKSIDEFGFLRVQNVKSDHIITVQDNGNSFDMMCGLIAPKLNK